MIKQKLYEYKSNIQQFHSNPEYSLEERGCFKSFFDQPYCFQRLNASIQPLTFESKFGRVEKYGSNQILRYGGFGKTGDFLIFLFAPETELF
jgi:hypothetical protein